MRFEYTGLFGVLVLIADVWAIVNIMGSSRKTGDKVLWVIVILLLPIVGWIIWLAAGPRASK
jgi:succinate dehydrogenase/fumarate reductase cytochrome b subunit